MRSSSLSIWKRLLAPEVRSSTCMVTSFDSKVRAQSRVKTERLQPSSRLGDRYSFARIPRLTQPVRTLHFPQRTIKEQISRAKARAGSQFFWYALNKKALPQYCNRA